MRDKNFYDYGFFKEYTEAKAANDTTKVIQMQHRCYDQYMELAHKMKWDLVKRLQKTYAIQDDINEMTANYEHDVYPELIKAMNCINMNSIPNKTKKNGQNAWQFYYAYWGYLSTYNRDTVSHYIKLHQNEMNTDFQVDCKEDKTTSLSVANKAALSSESLQTQSPEKLYEQKCEKNSFWKAVEICEKKYFTPIQKEIWNIKKNTDKKFSSKDICSKLNISPAVYNKEMKAIKSVFAGELAKNDITF